MGKIVTTIETEFDKGEVVIFKKDNCLLVGLIESYNVDFNAGQSVWYNIRTGADNVFTYSNYGDIDENDILMALDAREAEYCKECMKEISGKI